MKNKKKKEGKEEMIRKTNELPVGAFRLLHFGQS